MDTQYQYIQYSEHFDLLVIKLSFCHEISLSTFLEWQIMSSKKEGKERLDLNLQYFGTWP